MTENIVGQRFKEVLESLNISGTKLAKELKISQPAIAKTLQGKNFPSAKLLIPLGKKKGISIDWLLLGEGTMFKGEGQRGHAPQAEEGDKKNKTLAPQETNEINHLKKQIELLELALKEREARIKDKDELIELLKDKK